MTRPQVHITNPDGEPRSTRITVDGVDLSAHVTAVRWEHSALDGRPSVVLEVEAPGLDVLGDLTEVYVRTEVMP